MATAYLMGQSGSKIKENSDMCILMSINQTFNDTSIFEDISSGITITLIDVPV